MRNTSIENIQEHSLFVAVVSHALCVIKNKYYNGSLDADHAAILAVFHEASEVITGDLATPIKYFNPKIKKAYKDIELVASKKLLNMLPDELKEDYSSLLIGSEEDKKYKKIVKAADKICAYIKCIEEEKAGNREFSKAKDKIESDIKSYNMPEVDYFMDKFIPSFTLTLDELN